MCVLTAAERAIAGLSQTQLDLRLIGFTAPRAFCGRWRRHTGLLVPLPGVESFLALSRAVERCLRFRLETASAMAAVSAHAGKALGLGLQLGALAAALRAVSLDLGHGLVGYVAVLALALDQEAVPRLMHAGAAVRTETGLGAI